MELTLTATSQRSTFSLGSPIPLRVTLVNGSQTAVWVNRRFGPSYEDDLERELYFTLFDATGQPVPIADNERTDVHRLPPKREDFERLDPGASVSADVDLVMWHPLARPGSYRVVVHYDNHATGEPFGIQAFTGKLQAPPITFELR